AQARAARPTAGCSQNERRPTIAGTAADYTSAPRPPDAPATPVKRVRHMRNPEGNQPPTQRARSPPQVPPGRWRRRVHQWRTAPHSTDPAVLLATKAAAQPLRNKFHHRLPTMAGKCPWIAFPAQTLRKIGPAIRVEFVSGSLSG